MEADRFVAENQVKLVTVRPSGYVLSIAIVFAPHMLHHSPAKTLCGI